MLNQISRYYHTLKYLKWIQIKYQLRYRLMPSLPFFSSQTLDKNLTVNPLAQIDDSIMANTTWLGEDTFRFLNISHAFKKGIDWNYDKNGKLWTYNLTYFEFLSQPNISKYEGLGLIHDFIAKEKSIKDGMESFPISLRMIFWIKFLLKNKIQDDYINASMYRQFQKLSAKPEYHLLGNHLLENGFSLFFGGVYFDNKKLQKQGEQIITEQLQEQILEDGAHFELSPMYHQIILYRVLDS